MMKRHSITPSYAAICGVSMSGAFQATAIPSANALLRKTRTCLSDPESAVKVLEVIKLERCLTQSDGS